MFNSNSDSLKLLETATIENLYPKLISQLIKDFELANVTIVNLEGFSTIELITSLREKVYQLILERFTDYINLLYIVDVPESAFKDLKVTDAVEVAEQVAYLILKREYQKVRLKANYST